MTPFSLRRFALLFVRVGNLTFGGGDPTMAVFQRELTQARGWVTAEQYGLVYSLARATPGTNLLAFCGGIGWLLARWRGALIAILCCSIPCAAAVLLFTYGYELWRSNARAMSAIAGMLAAAAGMMTAAAFQLSRSGWRPGNRWRLAALVTLGFTLSFSLRVPPIEVLGIGALVGLVWRPR